MDAELAIVFRPAVLAVVLAAVLAAVFYFTKVVLIDVE